jgi:hypothetical protein
MVSVVEEGNKSTFNLATRVEASTAQANGTCHSAGAFRADDGTRTHDLLHGKGCVRALSLEFVSTGSFLVESQRDGLFQRKT